LPSAFELSDEISEQARRQIVESPVCRMFFAVSPNHETRFSDRAKMRLCQCGLTCQEVESALVLSNDDGEIPANGDRYRCHFVANLKVNQWLETLTEQKSGCFQKIDWTLEPDELFEYYSNSCSVWLPAKSSRAGVPLVLFNPRYIGFTAPTALGPSGPRVFVRIARYMGDVVTRCLAETVSVFCYALHTDRAASDKVSDMKRLLSPDVLHNSLHDGNSGVPRLSARALLERIRLAPGGFDYLSLLKNDPGSLDVNPVVEGDNPPSDTGQPFNPAGPELQIVRNWELAEYFPDELSGVRPQEESAASTCAGAQPQ